ncbi:MAG: CDP-alcohol phosphatidyltransferase family protein [Steroidobacteraceae bacterium]
MAPALTADARGPALLRSAAAHFIPAVILCGIAAASLGIALGLGQAFLPKAVGVFVAGSLLFAPTLRRDHPFATFGPANGITMARGVLTAVIAGFLGARVDASAALVIVGIGLVSLILDGFDGRFARRSGLASPFGARYDMETDAFLILVFSLLAWQLDKAGPWVVLSGLLRYLFIAAGWVLPWMRGALLPSRRRQTVCVIQIAVMLAVLLPFIASPLSDALSAATLCLLCYSFLVDVLWLRKAGMSTGSESAARQAAKGP